MKVFAMRRLHTTTIAFWVLAASLAMAGCQATSTAGNYHPDNCAMVGSRCSSGR